MCIKKAACTVLTNPTWIFAILAFISFAALATAFIAEGFLGLEPCQLCIYQRYPFAIGLFAGLIGLGLRKNRTVSILLLSLCAVAFLANSGIASYHTGVEQHWWESAVDGCTVPLFDEDNGKSILENIMSAPMGNCSEIPWQDPIFKLSMANWNIPFCLGLFVFCVLAIFGIKRRKPSTE